MRPLDRIRSIKLKLSIVIVVAVGISAGVSVIGVRTGIPIWIRPIISVSIALLLVYPFARGITSPLREMAAASQAMASGDYSHPVTATSRDEVGELAEAFNEMSAQLAEIDRERRDLVANVSHELRTPLAGLRARLENMADGVEPIDFEGIQACLAEIERLSGLVGQLLDLSRIDSGASPLYVEQFEVAPVLRHVAAATRVRDPRVDVEVVVSEDLVYSGDESRVEQLITNLVHNATRYSPPGQPVVVSARRTGSDLEMVVSDRGPGIPSGERHRVFERFYRSDHARTSDGGGTGLGLAIVRAIVELHQGTIEIRSNEPTGCRVVVSLPPVQQVMQ